MHVHGPRPTPRTGGRAQGRQAASLGSESANGTFTSSASPQRRLTRSAPSAPTRDRLPGEDFCAFPVLHVGHTMSHDQMVACRRYPWCELQAALDALPVQVTHQVVALARVAGVDVRDLEAALVRLGLRHPRPGQCPDGEKCTALAGTNTRGERSEE